MVGSARQGKAEIYYIKHFFLQAIGCAVDGNRMLLSCSLSVNGIASGEQLQSTHVQPTFFPQLPLHFGRIVREGELGEESFIGCISNLAINGVTEGFG